MIELTSSEYGEILPLLKEFPQRVLPYAICQGINPGRVFADRGSNPRVALIWTMVGYFFLAGDPAQASDLSEIRRVLLEIFLPASQAGGEDSFILIPSSPAWSECLAEILPGQALDEIYRRPFAFDPQRFAAAGDWHRRIPLGLHLHRVDAGLAQRLNVLASWASIDDFLRFGLGFAILDGDKIASACTSVLASRQKMEIDVHTAEAYRGQGLATICASAFIAACLQRGTQPNWECFWDNEASSHLALKLGFTPLPDYPVYYMEGSPLDR